MTSRQLNLSKWDVSNKDLHVLNKFKKKNNTTGSLNTGNRGRGNTSSSTYNSGSRGNYSSGSRGTYNSGSRGNYNSGSRGSYNSGSRGSYNSGSSGSYNSGSRGNYSSGSRGNYSSGSSGYGGEQNSGLDRYITDENTKRLIQDVSEKIVYVKNQLNEIHNWWSEIPTSIKLSNIILFGILTYIFTIPYYKLGASITFSIITFILLYMMNKLQAIVYLFIYIIIVIKIIRDNNYIYGFPIPQTVINNGQCLTSSLTISGSKLPQELSPGNYSYSFWIYVSDTVYTVNHTNMPYTIFYRGESINSTNQRNFIQFPGFWLDQKTNNLIIRFYGQNSNRPEDITVLNIDLDQWFQVTCVENELSVAVYINGKLEITKILSQPLMIMNDYGLYIISGISLNQSTNGTTVANNTVNTVNNNGSTTCQTTGTTICQNNGSGSTNYGGLNFTGKLAYIVLYNYSLSPDDVYKAYIYYKKFIDKYQMAINNKIVYPTSPSTIIKSNTSNVTNNTNIMNPNLNRALNYS